MSAVLPDEVSPLVEVHAARLSYGESPVLRGIDLTVHSGEVVAIIGPSGSGKSTLLRAIANLERLDSGQIRIAGERMGVARSHGRLRELGDRQARQQRRNLGYVFQSFNLFGNLTAVRNVVAGLRAIDRLGAAEARERGIQLLERVGLAHRADAYPRQLSGGQQQRVAIARALARSPQVLLLDEPTSALDPELVGEVLRVIRELAAERRTMVLVTHEIGFARTVADRVVFLDEGEIVETGPPREVLDHPRQPRTQEFLASVLQQRSQAPDPVG